MTYVKTPQGKLYYEVTGKGFPVVLIRGLGCCSEHWMGWENDLNKTHRVIVLDNRGLGKSTQPIRVWHTMSDLASDVATVLKAERISKAHIAGVSLGGMIALQFGLDYPEITESITAVNSSIGGSGHLRLSVNALRALTLKPIQGNKSYRQLARLLTASNASDEVLRKIYQGWCEIESRYPKPYASVIAQLSIASRWNDWPSLAKIQAPVHIISSDDDQFVPRGNSLFLSEKIPSSKLSRLADSGHEPHIDQPEELLKVVTDFFQKIERKT